MADINVIARRHPDYERMVPQWQFLQEAYADDDRAFIERHLVPFFREERDDFVKRKELAWRDNHTRTLIRLFFGYMGQQAPTRRFDNEQLQVFVDDANRAGESLYRCMLTAGELAAVSGNVFIVVDRKAKADGSAWTNADNLANEYQPYCYTLLPQDMLDFAMDDDGTLVWALVRETQRDDRDPWISTGDTKTSYRLWERSRWTLFDSDGQQIDQQANPINAVPIVPLFCAESSSPYVGASMIAGVTRKDKSLMNDWSDLEWSIRAACFPAVCMPVGEDDLRDITTATEDRLDDAVVRRTRLVEISRSSVIMYHGDTPPQYLSWDTAQLVAIREHIESKVKQLFAAFGLEGEIGVSVGQESGVAKGYRFNKLNRLLAGFADLLEAAERRVVQLWAKYMGIDNIDYVVDYPDTFDTKTLSDSIDEAERLATMAISARFVAEIHKALAAKALPKAPPDVRAAIESEIDQNAASDSEAARQPRFPFDQKEGVDGGGDGEE